MSSSPKNIWLLVSGPSGVGKTTVIERLIAAFSPQLQPIVTATTRNVREGEREGREYYFLTREEFLKRKSAGAFLETIERHGVLYGTPKAEVERKLSGGHDLIMPVDWQGRQIFASAKLNGPAHRIISVFLKPQSMPELKARLEKRGRNTPEELHARLKLAEVELQHTAEYDYEFVSTTPDEDFARMSGIYREGKSAT